MSTLTIADLEAFDRGASSGGTERRFCCPLCGNEKPMDATHRSLAVNTQTGAWTCHRCGAKGVLGEWCRPERERRPARLWRPPQLPSPSVESVQRFQQAWQHVKEITGTPAADYLEGRGIPADLARQAHCGYAQEWPGLGEAVVFPIVDENNKPIAANARSLCGSEKRTYGPKSLGVFLTPGALDADPVAITEAPIDALSLAVAGLPAIALCGTSPIPRWVTIRLGRPAPMAQGRSRTILLAFDNDQAGETAAECIGRIIANPQARRLRPEHKDWNDDLMHGGVEALRARCGGLRSLQGSEAAHGDLPRRDMKNHPSGIETASESPSRAVEGHSVRSTELMPRIAATPGPCVACKRQTAQTLKGYYLCDECYRRFYRLGD